MSDDTNAESKAKTTSLEASSVVMCSICLDEVSDDVDRSRAKLQCGHEFHLDCIGSAFNIKGEMKCPNCRKVEKGRWLYASGSTRSLPDISMDDWVLREDQFGLSYPEIAFNIHWCPYSGLARVHSAFEVLESSAPQHPNLHRHQNIFAEHGAAASGTHPYIANYRPPTNTNDTMEDPNFNNNNNNNWNGVSNPHLFPVNDMHYNNGVHHSHILPANNAHSTSTDQAPLGPVSLRSTRVDFGPMPRSRSYMNPFLFGHGGRSHERLQASHTIHHPHQPTNPLGIPAAIIPNRFHGRRTLPPLPMPTNSVSNRNGGFFVVPPRGSSVQNSHETSVNSVPDRNGGFFVVPTRGSSAQSTHERESLLPNIPSDWISGRIQSHNGAGSDPNTMHNSWDGFWS